MVKPEVRKRFVDSIDYLRKMGFFQEYSNLSSEEILNKIFRGEINYKHWWWEEKKGREPSPPWGRLLKKRIEGNENSWMKASDARIDYEIIPFDTKRVLYEISETGLFDEEMGKIILNRLARISRGVFQPENISCRWLTQGTKWLIQEVSFDFKDKRHSIEIAIRHDWLIDLGLRELNELIKDTGYQYYQLRDEEIMIVMLTKDEAEKLERERGWSFEYLT